MNRTNGRIVLCTVLGSLAVWLFFLSCLPVVRVEAADEGLTIQNRPQKKLIQAGWGVPDSAYLLANIREMEKEPFDGIWFRIEAKRPDGGSVGANRFHVFTKHKVDESWFAHAYENLQKVEFRKFTDNFIGVGITPGDMDWFNDEDWMTALSNVELLLKAGKIAGCKGIFFDPEVYDRPPSIIWSPEKLKANPSLFDKYAHQARLRGRQFMKTVGKYMPEATILCLQLCGSCNTKGAFDVSAPRSVLIQEYFCLLPAFLNGMLDEIQPGMTIVDGNELAYYYDTELDFYRGYHLIRRKALRVIAPENVRKYQTRVQVGHGLYVDRLFKGTAPAPEMAKRFEDMLYYALTTSDEYVWTWNECWLFWPKEQRRLPHGIKDAILNARDRLAGIDPKDLRDLTVSVDDQRQGRSQATIPALPADLTTPKLDGDLSDPAWQCALHIEEFFKRLRLKSHVQTQAWVTYDSENLYVAFRCHEPKMKDIKVIGNRHDNEIWRGDSVDVFVSNNISSRPFYHYILNPDNVHWDALDTDSAGFNGQWKSAVKKMPDAWQAEIVLPWSQMGMDCPPNGAELRANLCRNRKHSSELSSWSVVTKGFVEPDYFGFWTFAPPMSKCPLDDNNAD